MFIAPIETISLLQTLRMLAFTANYGRRVIEQTFPSLELARPTPDPDEYLKFPVTQARSHKGRPQAFQAPNVPALRASSTASGGAMVVVSPVGNMLVEGRIMLRVHCESHWPSMNGRSKAPL